MNYFFDIPVYRLSSKKYYDDFEQYKNKHIYNDNDEVNQKLKKQFDEKYPELRRNFEEYLFKKFGGIWDYNEIIGYVKLYSVGNQIRGEYFQIDKKRICKTRIKTFEWQTDKLVPEIDFYDKNTNEEIFNKIYKYLEDCRKELKYRYLDLDNFIKIGKYLDWKKLLSSQTKNI